MELRRVAPAHLASALRLVWASSPGWTMANVAVVLLQAALSVLALLLFKQLVDTLADATASTLPFESIPRLAALIGLVCAVALLSTLCSSAESAIGDLQRDRVSDHMHGIIHARLVQLDLEHFESAAQQDLLHRTQASVASRANTILASLMQAARSGVSLVAIGGLLLTLNGWVVLLLVAGDLPGAYARIRTAWALYQWERAHTPIDRRARYYDILLGVHGAHDVRLFDLGALFTSRFRRLRKQLRDERAPLIAKRVAAESAGHLSAVLAMFAVYGIIAHQALSGRLSVGEVVMFLAAFQRGHGYLRDLLLGAARLYESSLFLGDLAEVLALESRVVEPANALAVPRPLRVGIRFEQVDFSYPGARSPALRGVSLVAAPGERIAIVGPNGSGKTTLVKLLCRMYDPSAGRITADNIALTSFAKQAWRHEISAFVQDYGKYQLSARENIWLGNLAPMPDDTALVAAARRSGAHSVIERLRQGYDTVLGNGLEQGVELSVGEWQKVALARTYVRQPQILVLDEPTNSMDALSEQNALQAVWGTSTECITLLVTHRLSAARLADRIYVLAEGRVVESGNHDELMRLGASYAELFTAQSRHYQ